MTRSLSKRCLVNLDTRGRRNIFSIHRSLQVALRLELDKDTVRRQDVFNRATSIVCLASPTASPLQVPSLKDWPQFEQTTPHSVVLARAFAESEPPLEPAFELAELLYNAGFHVWESWGPSTRDGILLLGTSERILDLLEYDPDGILRAHISTMAALIMLLMGGDRSHVVFQRLQQSYRIRETILSISAPDDFYNNEHLYYNAKNDLALYHLQLDNSTEAEKLISQCLLKYNEWGDEHTHGFEFIKYYSNMSTVRMYQGRYDEALSLNHKGTEIAEIIAGRDNTSFWRRHYQTACVLLQAGRLEAALEEHLLTLENRRRVCGPSHEVTLQSIYAVGAMYYHLEDFPEAT